MPRPGSSRQGTCFCQYGGRTDDVRANGERHSAFECQGRGFLFLYAVGNAPFVLAAPSARTGPAKADLSHCTVLDPLRLTLYLSGALVFYLVFHDLHLSGLPEQSERKSSG